MSIKRKTHFTRKNFSSFRTNNYPETFKQDLTFPEDISEPILVEKNGIREWAYSITDDNLFSSSESEFYKEEIPQLDKFKYFVDWILKSWPYWGTSLLACLALKFLEPLLEYLKASTFSGWVINTLKIALEYEPFAGISVISGIIYLYLIFNLISFLVLKAWNFKTELAESELDLELAAKVRGFARAREIRNAKINETCSRLNYIANIQDLTIQARESLNRQIEINKANRLSLNNHLGKSNVPEDNDQLAPLIFQSLSNAFSQVKNKKVNNQP